MNYNPDKSGDCLDYGLDIKHMKTYMKHQVKRIKLHLMLVIRPIL